MREKDLGAEIGRIVAAHATPAQCNSCTYKRAGASNVVPMPQSDRVRIGRILAKIAAELLTEPATAGPNVQSK